MILHQTCHQLLTCRITTCTRSGTTKLAGTTATIGPHTGRNSATMSINEAENDTRLDYNICAIVGNSHQEQQVTLLTHLSLIPWCVCSSLYNFIVCMFYKREDVTSMLISCVYNHLSFSHHVSSLVYSPFSLIVPTDRC